MRKKLLSRPRVWVLFISLIVLVVTAAYVSAQNGAYAITGKLVPFADATDSPNNVVTLETHVMFPAGAVSPWHFHTGDVYMVVSQGIVTEDLGCGKTMAFPAGTVAHTPVNTVHRVINYGNNEAIFAVFQIYPNDQPFNKPASEPSCN
jgi:quercetin dioxygenase-like cupin family protein